MHYCDSFTNLPLSRRFQRTTDGSLFFIILEKKLNHLDHFLKIQWRDTYMMGYPVYLHGIQGFGKSRCLYYKAWQLSEDPNYRVAYIPDCEGIADEPFHYFFMV